MLFLGALLAGAYVFHAHTHKVARLIVQLASRLHPALVAPFVLSVFGQMFCLDQAALWLGKRLPRLARRLQRAPRAVMAAMMCSEAPLCTTTALALETCTVGKDHTLRAYLVLPDDVPGPYPTVIFRTPYGAQPDEPGARTIAEHGFAVLVQDTRGRFSSEGDFVPVQDEREDGAATVDWVRKQPWCNGRVGVCGMSYVGLTAWAAIGTAGAKIDAGLIVKSQSRVKKLLVDANGAINLELIATWVFLVFHILAGKGKMKFLFKFWSAMLKKPLTKAYRHTPMRGMDHLMLGRPMELWQHGIDIVDNFDDPFWDDKDVLHDFSEPTPPLQLVAGWYDFFKECQLEDFKKAGPRARLLILPTWHWGIWKSWPLVLNVHVWTFQEHLQARRPSNTVFPSSRVWAAALGDGELENWFLPFDDWPPPCVVTSYYLHDSELRTAGGGAWKRSYRSDPADPTPSIGGPSFSLVNAGPADQERVEKRQDVLVFTSPPLTEQLLIAGRVTLELSVEVGSASADFVGRLCDVMPDGKSVNRCEGLTRVAGPGRRAVTVDLGNTCCRFRPGHRLRLHVCSAAFPRLMRNLQTGEPVADATQMEAAWHTVGEGSVLRLPVIPRPPPRVNLLPSDRWDWASRPETHVRSVGGEMARL